MCKTWTQLWADCKPQLDAAGITVRVICGQKEEHVGWARRDWPGVPDDWIVGDEHLTVCHAIKNAGVADIHIAPHAWDPYRKEPKTSSYKAHPEYMYPHGMHQPAVVMLRKLEPKAQACDGCGKETMALFMDPNEHGATDGAEGATEAGSTHYAVKDKSQRRYCTGCAKPGVHTRRVPATEMGGAFPPADPIYTNVSKNVKPRPAPKQCTKYLAKAVASANAGQPVPPVDGKWETKFGIPQVCCGRNGCCCLCSKAGCVVM